MDNSKLIWFNIVTFVTMLATLTLYFTKGLAPLSYTTQYAMAILPALVTLIVLFIVNLLVILSFLVARGLYKKNLLRVSMLLLIVMLIVTIGGRVYEVVVVGTFCWSCLIMVVLWIVLLVLNIIMLRDLYKLIQDLFSYQKKR